MRGREEKEGGEGGQSACDLLNVDGGWRGSFKELE